MSRLKNISKTHASKKAKTSQFSHRISLILMGIILIISFISAIFVKYKPHAHLLQFGQKVLDTTAQHLGFVTRQIIIQGQTHLTQEEIMQKAMLSTNVPLHRIKLEEVAQRLSQLSWVEQVFVKRIWPESILIKVIERAPVALWQMNKKLHLVDKQGNVIIAPSLSKFYYLPHIMGAKAPLHIHELMKILQSYSLLNQRITSRVFIDERRWDLIIDEKVRIKLPEKNIEKAVAHLETLRKKGHINSDDIISIDLRIEDRTYFELTPSALTRQLRPVERLS